MRKSVVSMSSCLRGCRIPFAPHTTRLKDVLETLCLKRAPMAVVMDEHGGTAGSLTAEDLLEEVAGEIREDLLKLDDFWEHYADDAATTVLLETLGDDGPICAIGHLRSFR